MVRHEAVMEQKRQPFHGQVRRRRSEKSVADMAAICPTGGPRQAHGMSTEQGPIAR